MPDANDDTLALVRAVKRGQTMLVEHLIAAGAAANGRIHGGRSPLFVAAERGDVVMIRLLLASGAVTRGPAARPRGAGP